MSPAERSPSDNITTGTVGTAEKGPLGGPASSVGAVQTILVVAEAPWIRNLVRSAFLRPGERVVEARRGQDARIAVAEHAPDVAFVDMQVGNMGGFAITIDLHLESGAGRIPSVPVILLLDRVADRFLARRADADVALVKPVTTADLRTAAEPYLTPAAAVGHDRDAAPDGDDPTSAETSNPIASEISADA